MNKDIFEKSINKLNAQFELKDALVELLWEKFQKIPGNTWNKTCDYLLETKKFTPKIVDFFDAIKQFYRPNEEKSVHEKYIYKLDSIRNLPDRICEPEPDRTEGFTLGLKKREFCDGTGIIERQRNILPRFYTVMELDFMFQFARKIEGKTWRMICNCTKTGSVEDLIQEVLNVLNREKEKKKKEGILK